MAVSKSKRKVMVRSSVTEKTQPQTLDVIQQTDGILTETGCKPDWKMIDRMRKHPTITLTRQLIIAPVLAAEWQYREKDAPAGARELIEEELDRQRLHLLRTSFQGYIDYGWAPYEKVFKIRNDDYVGIKKLKPLLQYFTDIVVDPKTGAYNGLRQCPWWQTNNREVWLNVPQSLCITIDYEGTDWYGHSIFESTESAYLQYESARKGADRYDQKVAGSHWVIHYPPGENEYDGATYSNDEIANMILNRLEASGKMAVPRALEAFVDEMNKPQEAWKIELLSDVSNATSNFIERLKYLDNLLVRTFGVPERSILEGSFGTKAEAESHGEAAVLNMDMRHRLAVVQYNEHLVNHLLRINYGEEYANTVWIEPSPLDKGQKKLLMEVYSRILQSPAGAEEVAGIDTGLLKSELGIPYDPEFDPIKEDLNGLLRNATSLPGVREDERTEMGGPEQ